MSKIGKNLANAIRGSNNTTEYENVILYFDNFELLTIVLDRRSQKSIGSIFQLLTFDENESVMRDPNTGLCIPGNLGLLVKRRNKYSQRNKYVGIPGLLL